MRWWCRMRGVGQRTVGIRWEIFDGGGVGERSWSEGGVKGERRGSEGEWRWQWREKGGVKGKWRGMSGEGGRVRGDWGGVSGEWGVVRGEWRETEGGLKGEWRGNEAGMKGKWRGSEGGGGSEWELEWEWEGEGGEKSNSPSSLKVLATKSPTDSTSLFTPLTHCSWNNSLNYLRSASWKFLKLRPQIIFFIALILPLVAIIYKISAINYVRYDP